MPNQVWTADSDGALNWLNDRTYDFTGYREGELFGENWARVVHPDDLEIALANWSTAINDGVEYETEFRIRKSDGCFRWHLVRASPLLTDGGALAGWVGTNTDIEERKNAEAEIAKLNETLESRVAIRNHELEEVHATLRQSQKMEAIGNLAGGIAHDFNNLLQVITGNLQLASREVPEGSLGQARLDQAKKSVMRAATLSSQLLSFARKQPLAPVATNLGRLLGDTMDILRSAIGEGVALETILADGLWNTSVDPNNMENAILNLAINARDAMDGNGNLKIDIGNADIDGTCAKTHPDIDQGQYVVLAVTDTGCGIPPEVVEKIFEPFFTTKEDGHGTGLGLSMVYGFAKQSGGHITIDSLVGSGTTIRIYLPRSMEQEQIVEPVGTAGLWGGTETILLVEDDEDVRETAVNTLVDLGYKVLQATNAQDALTLLVGDQHIDLLFTDVVMPGKINGHQLAEEMRKNRPELPVLFTSGYVHDSIVHDGRLDEGVQLLGKPYTQSALQQKIREVLGSEGIQTCQSSSLSPPVSPQIPQSAASPTNNISVLVCEDDILIRTDIVDGLREAGFKVLEAANALSALNIMETNCVDVLITDVGLPDKSGEELAQDARKLAPDLPVIFATGGIDVPSSAALGNCMVLSKPFQDSQLLKAIEAMTCSHQTQ